MHIFENLKICSDQMFRAAPETGISPGQTKLYPFTSAKFVDLLRWTCPLVASLYPYSFIQAPMLEIHRCIFRSFCESFNVLLSPGLRLG